ncbi:hypothetical protein MYX76_08980 [Desulfobacterota bacterium AH_259_B03_O07]|nr:hypothetical protein [Desulfobacterota bacterium AH_259_B03_O07]
MGHVSSCFNDRAQRGAAPRAGASSRGRRSSAAARCYVGFPIPWVTMLGGGSSFLSDGHGTETNRIDLGLNIPASTHRGPYPREQ